ncbi:uncharacterized protein LOC111643133 [Copidosoma floridanum]|uniref:uncharacterized protein LOC111643133 n=1 Tax=Copidosoma floridanum TaxID=29053 RepID=UPI000C6F800F|nr:uncharacterized protein LOC111643133 [Copidosoma floridanum]
MERNDEDASSAAGCSYAFLAAYARFCARRGACKKLYSDNATTFEKPDKELQALFAKSSPFMDSVVSTFTTQRTQWSFIPPHSPHFGRLWEVVVRSFKHHFRRVIGDHSLTFEELSTLAAKIEACLNSRPLCLLSTDPKNAVTLTLVHFLTGSSLLSSPEPYDKATQPISLNDRWRLLGNLRDSFRSRWRKEVLHLLQRRNKWLDPEPNLQKGDAVLLMDELSPPTQWRLGLVIEAHLGAVGDLGSPIPAWVEIVPDLCANYGCEAQWGIKEGITEREQVEHEELSEKTLITLLYNKKTNSNSRKIVLVQESLQKELKNMKTNIDVQDNVGIQGERFYCLGDKELSF